MIPRTPAAAPIIGMCFPTSSRMPPTAADTGPAISAADDSAPPTPAKMPEPSIPPRFNLISAAAAVSWAAPMWGPQATNMPLT